MPNVTIDLSHTVPVSADAEDLTTEVLLKMVEALPNYRWTGAPFEAWLYSTASARVIDFRRRAANRFLRTLSETIDNKETLPEEVLQQNQELETLRKAIQRLNDEQQAVLVLRFIARKSHQEVADILGKAYLL